MRGFAIVARGDGYLRQLAAAFVAVVILARLDVAHNCLLIFHFKTSYLSLCFKFCLLDGKKYANVLTKRL